MMARKRDKIYLECTKYNNWQVLRILRNLQKPCCVQAVADRPEDIHHPPLQGYLQGADAQLSTPAMGMMI